MPVDLATLGILSHLANPHESAALEVTGPPVQTLPAPAPVQARVDDGLQLHLQREAQCYDLPGREVLEERVAADPGRLDHDIADLAAQGPSVDPGGDAHTDAPGGLVSQHNLPSVWQRALDIQPRRETVQQQDTIWELAPRARIRAGLADWLIDLGASTSVADAQRELAKLTGLSVAAETIRQYPEQRGNEIEMGEATAAQTVVRTPEAAAPLEPAPGTLVGETEGVVVRDQSGWREVKLGLAGGQVKRDVHAVERGKGNDPATSELTALSYLAARQSEDAFGPRLLAEATRRGALEIVGWDGPITGRPLAQ
jgi:hypothetical protein